MSDIEFSEAAKELVEEIQRGSNYVEAYALMLTTFINCKEQGETNRMAVTLAKKAIENNGEDWSGEAEFWSTLNEDGGGNE